MKVRDLVELSLLYVGVPAVTLYPLGFVGLLIQVWRDNFFPYYDYDTIWNAVAMVPHTVVVGTGVELLYFSAVSTLLGMGVASLIRGLLGKRSATGEKRRSRRSLWIFYVLVLLPVTAFMIYDGIHVNDGHDIFFLGGFILFSAVGGALIGQVTSRGHDEWFYPGLIAAYVAAVLAATCIAALDTPTLPLVEINAQPGDEVSTCSELPGDRTFVKVSEAPNLMYLYNESGFFALSVFDVKPVRYHQDCPESRTQS